MRKGKGFTLIELLVVIAIIAILAAILFPIFSGAKKRATMSKCINNLKQLGTGMRMYADDNGGRLPHDWPPPTAGVYFNYDWCGTEGAHYWVYPERGQIWRYTKNAAIYMCPSDIGRDAPYIKYGIPAGKKSRDYPLSYVMNNSLDRRIVDAVTLSSKRMLLLHENRGEVKGAPIGINDGTYVPKSPAGGGNDTPGIVHYDGATLVYLDGHACWKNQRTLLEESNTIWYVPK